MADSDHFGVGGGIKVTAHRIARLGDYFVAQRNHRPNRHLAGLRGNGGEIERAAHRRRQRKGHDRVSATVPAGICHALKARYQYVSGQRFGLPPLADGFRRSEP